MNDQQADKLTARVVQACRHGRSTDNRRQSVCSEVAAGTARRGGESATAARRYELTVGASDQRPRSRGCERRAGQAKPQKSEDLPARTDRCGGNARQRQRLSHEGKGSV